MRIPKESMTVVQCMTVDEVQADRTPLFQKAAIQKVDKNCDQ